MKNKVASIGLLFWLMTGILSAAGLGKILANQPVQVLPHKKIIAKLDAAGKTIKVLLMKTALTQPYPSVFFQLECGYWNADSEAELRQAINQP